MSHNIPFLPFHVVEQILLNLDPQTLIKFSVVCRDWHSLITSPDFISRNVDRTIDSRKEVLLLKICHRKESELFHLQESFSLHSDNDKLDLLRTVQISPIDHMYKRKVVGTSKGVVCLADNRHYSLILWNPTVRKYALLPRLLITLDEQNRSVGFGFDSRGSDFKVVNLVHHNLKIDTAWVFSYATWSWKCLTDSTPPPCQVHIWAHPVLINGVLHWIAMHKVRHYKFVLTFDLANEVFGEILLPESIARQSSVSIVAAGDSLAVSENKYKSYGEVKVSRVWSVCIMKQYGVHKSWENILITKHEDWFSIPRRQELIPWNVLAITKNGDMILETEGDMIREFEGGQILRYNPTTSTTNVLAQGVIKNGVFIGYHAESLYLLEKGEDVISY